MTVNHDQDFRHGLIVVSSGVVVVGGRYTFLLPRGDHNESLAGSVGADHNERGSTESMSDHREALSRARKCSIETEMHALWWPCLSQMLSLNP